MIKDLDDLCLGRWLLVKHLIEHHQNLQRLQERLEAIHVANAREQGWSWQAIANALEVSRQAVHQKYNRRR